MSALWDMIREYEKENEELKKENKLMKSFIENNELDLLKEFKDYFPNGFK